MSQGYGLSLIAETTSGRFISAERCISAVELLRCREEQIVPEDVGVETAHMLLEEVKRCVVARTLCGAWRSRHQTRCPDTSRSRIPSDPSPSSLAGVA